MRVKFVVIIIALVYNTTASAQGSFGRYELGWAIIHPFVAFKVISISKACNAIYKKDELKIRLDTFISGGRYDAYRHVFFMASFAQKIKVKKVRKLGIAHEKSNYHQFRKKRLENKERPDSLGSVMDFYNNEVGFKLGLANCKIQRTELSELVVQLVKRGEARILKRNKKSDYLDCDGNIINISDHSGKWFVPKCLVASDTPYSD